jgi:hypothetical protein
MELVTLKIVDHISMTPWAITMTIEVKTALTLDVSKENDVLFMLHPHLESNDVAAAIWFVAGESAAVATKSVLQATQRWIEANMPNHAICLLVGSSTWQPDTRIVRHYGLAGALKAQHLVIPPLQELLVEAAGKIKYFGVADLSGKEIDEFANVIVSEKCCYMVVIDKPINISELPKEGWTGNIIEDKELVLHIVNAGGILIQRFGSFDDQDKGMLLIGQPALIESSTKALTMLSRP